MNIMWGDLVIEVTRRCNMACAHCLRGEAENKDMPLGYMSELLRHTSCIGNLVFTGGEPSLAVDKMRFFRELCKRRSINVYGFYVVTNGKEVTEDFLHEMLEWYTYVNECGGEPDTCGVALSKDMFHETIPKRNELLLRGLSFFTDGKFTDFRKGGLLDLGRARGIVSYAKREASRLGEISADVVDDGIAAEDCVTMTVEGDFIPDCDYEYEEVEDIKVGNVRDMEAFMRYLKGGSANEAVHGAFA